MAGDVTTWGYKKTLGSKFVTALPAVANTDMFTASVRCVYGNDPSVVDVYANVATAGNLILHREYAGTHVWETLATLVASTSKWVSFPATSGEYLNLCFSATGYNINYIHVMQTDTEVV